MAFFTTTAHAATQGAATSGGSSMFGFLIPLIGFGLMIYFLIWRPQNARLKAQKSLLKNLAAGDEVTTNGGLIGTITVVDEHFVQIDIASGVNVKMRKEAVVNVLPKGTQTIATEHSK